MHKFRLGRELKGGNWYCYYGEGTRQQRRSMGTKDKGLADERMKAFIALYLQPKNADPADILIENVLRQYQTDQGSEAMSQYTSTLVFSQLMAYYVGKPVAYITKTTNKKFEKDQRKERGWANATINRVRAVLRASLRHAVENGDITSVPHIPMLEEPIALQRWLLRIEAARLLRAVHANRWYYVRLFILIGLYTAARHSAILQLTWDRVDLVDGRIDFHVPGRTMTNKRRPHAPMHPRLLAFLRYARTREERLAKEEGRAIIPYVVHHRGGPIKDIDKAFRAACGRAKIEGVTPHTLKHTCITWYLRRKMSVWDVAGLTATSVATIERVYGKHVQDGLREALFASNSQKTPKSFPISNVATP